jgi:hypothetical protein
MLFKPPSDQTIGRLLIAAVIVGFLSGIALLVYVATLK